MRGSHGIGEPLLGLTASPVIFRVTSIASSVNLSKLPQYVMLTSLITDYFSCDRVRTESLLIGNVIYSICPRTKSHICLSLSPCPCVVRIVRPWT